jgi:hypothetical protein
MRSHAAEPKNDDALRGDGIDDASDDLAGGGGIEPGPRGQ